MRRKPIKSRISNRYNVQHIPLMGGVDFDGWISNEFAHVKVSAADYIVERVKTTVSAFEAHRAALRGLQGVYDFTNGKKARAILTFDDEVYII